MSGSEHAKRYENSILRTISRTLFEWIGKPEALKQQFKGYRSPIISDEHRLVYSVNENDIQILSCKYHYKD